MLAITSRRPPQRAHCSISIPNTRFRRCERTAVFHMNNAIKKLGATNKIQAIVRAVVLKLL
jgi:hypothetical protein